jgi:hypothetical protein
MSSKDVEALLGEPQDVSPHLGGLNGRTNGTIRSWQGDKVEIELAFPDDVLAGGAANSTPQDNELKCEFLDKDESFLDRIRRLLHL